MPQDSIQSPSQNVCKRGVNSKQNLKAAPYKHPKKHEFCLNSMCLSLCCTLTGIPRRRQCVDFSAFVEFRNFEDNGENSSIGQTDRRTLRLTDGRTDERWPLSSGCSDNDDDECMPCLLSRCTDDCSSLGLDRVTVCKIREWQILMPKD